MAPMIPAAIISKALQQGGGAAASAMKNDIATIEWTKKGKVKGKGKKKVTTPDRHVQVHVNPVSLTIGAGLLGAAAVTGAAALWIAGLGLSRENSATRNYIVRNAGTEAKPSWRIYNGRGVAIRSPMSSEPSRDDILLRSDVSRGWQISDVADHGTFKTYVATNDSKKHFSIEKRERFSVGGIKLF